MRIYRVIFLFWFLFLSLVNSAQQVSNIHFEQVGKQIHIYYDMEGDQAYTIQVYCSTDNGKSWGNPLKEVSGAVGESQKPGNSKMIVWDVLAEREKLSGETRFKIEILPGNIGFFTDSRDGQTYKWVKIGEQVWMAENLNYKTKNSWCYVNKPRKCDEYGRLYKWDAARTACPSGWHLPTDEEWKTFEMHLGMSQSQANKVSYRGTDEGNKLKSTSGWTGRGNGTDEVGFTALPSGYRRTSGSFSTLGGYGNWWSATEYSSSGAWHRYLLYNRDKVSRSTTKKGTGFSVRCLRD